MTTMKLSSYTITVIISLALFATTTASTNNVIKPYSSSSKSALRGRGLVVVGKEDEPKEHYPARTLSSAPDCNNEPILIGNDITDIRMCHYDPEIVQIKEKNTNDVTIAITNVWMDATVPEKVQVFVAHNTNDNTSSDPINTNGFQCSDEHGTYIDVEGIDDNNNEMNLQCYRENENDTDSPFVAIIDVVITDKKICGYNKVTHPCFPDRQILRSCSWKLIIPCEYEECTEAPTVPPSPSPSSQPTMGDWESSQPPMGEDWDPCPNDILLRQQEGITKQPDDAIRIIGQDDRTVTVQLTQSYTTNTNNNNTASSSSSSSNSIDYMFYQYNPKAFDVKCYKEDNVIEDTTIELTIECTHISRIALLEVWIADELEKGILTKNDTAILPDCCHPDDVPVGMAITKYKFEIRCDCPERIGF